MSHTELSNHEVTVCSLKQYYQDSSSLKWCLCSLDGRYRAFISGCVTTTRKLNQKSSGISSHSTGDHASRMVESSWTISTHTTTVHIEFATTVSKSRSELKNLLRNGSDMVEVLRRDQGRTELENFIQVVHDFARRHVNPDFVCMHYETVHTFDSFLANVHAFGTGEDFLFEPLKFSWPEGGHTLRRLVNRWRRGPAQRHWKA